MSGSRTEIHRPSTWTFFRQGLCEKCRGSCCSLPVDVSAQDLVRLGAATADESRGSLKKLSKRLIREGLIQSYHSETQHFLMAQTQAGLCRYLDPQSRLCTVYERRPDVCRVFPDIGPRPGYCPCIPKSSLKSPLSKA